MTGIETSCGSRLQPVDFTSHARSCLTGERLAMAHCRKPTGAHDTFFFVAVGSINHTLPNMGRKTSRIAA